MSHLHGRIVTSCFLDTILVPLCTWVYLAALVVLIALPTTSRPSYRSGGLRRKTPFGSRKGGVDAEVDEDADMRSPARRRGKTQLVLAILYYLLVLAQILMCVLEITRLELAHLGIGLLPFTFVALIVAGVVRFTAGLAGRVAGWKWANLALWLALAVMNGVKVAEEVKEGIGMRKGSKYAVVDELTDVSVMIGVYAALAVLEMAVRR